MCDVHWGAAGTSGAKQVGPAPGGGSHGTWSGRALARGLSQPATPGWSTSIPETSRPAGSQVPAGSCGDGGGQERVAQTSRSPDNMEQS